jgi:hypothetical protein
MNKSISVLWFGVGYHVRTAVAEGLASIYAGLDSGET